MDVTPNYALEKERLELDRAQLVFNIQSQRYRVSQINDEAARISVNIKATELAISELDKQIGNLKVKE